jgi:hypothetical protein
MLPEFISYQDGDIFTHHWMEEFATDLGAGLPDFFEGSGGVWRIVYGTTTVFGLSRIA